MEKKELVKAQRGARGVREKREASVSSHREVVRWSQRDDGKSQWVDFLHFDPSAPVLQNALGQARSRPPTAHHGSAIHGPNGAGPLGRARPGGGTCGVVAVLPDLASVSANLGRRSEACLPSRPENWAFTEAASHQYKPHLSRQKRMSRQQWSRRAERGPKSSRKR